MITRNAVLAVALAFGVMETTDIPHTGAPAAVFAALYLGCSLWLWRRGGRVVAVVIAALCAVEASQAHTWKGVSSALKGVAMTLGTAGILAAAAYLVVQSAAARTSATRS
jgi:hypothetical protein